MDEPLNIPSDADANFPAPDGEDSATPRGHEASSPHQGATGQGTFLWTEGAVNLSYNPFDSSPNALELAYAPESHIDGTARNITGIGSHALSVANDSSLLSNQQSLATLVEDLSKVRVKKRLSVKLSSKAGRLLREYPDIDVNELANGVGILHCACHYDRLELLDAILERPTVNVNLRTHEGLAGLHIACHEDNVAVVIALLQSPHIDVNIRDGSNSRTPLHVSAMQGNQATMKQLLDVAGIDVQPRDASGYLPVHYAAGHPILPIGSWFSDDTQDHTDEILLRLCSNGAINARTPQKKGPLHLAAEARNIAAMRFFLRQPDLDVNMTDSQGNTALYLSEDINVVGLLLEKGLDANIQNVDGNTALHCALERRCEELAQLLLTSTNLDGDMVNKKGEQFIHIAAAKWDIATFKTLAATPLNRNINMPAGNGETVLHVAARMGNIDVVEYLLSTSRIAVNAQDEKGRTALHLACEKGHVDVVKDLISAPLIYVNTRDERRQTPLHLACQKGHLDVVRVLLGNVHIDAEPGDVHGWTPLHFATCSESASGEPIVCELLRARIDVNRQVPVSGATALHFASLGGHFKMVLDLLEHGADPRLTCDGLVGPDDGIGKDAAGVADKIEIVDLIRHFRWRRISLAPIPLSYPQEGLLKRHASGVYIMWEWPRTENSTQAHHKSTSHKRQRMFPDISPVYKIYIHLASISQKPYCYEEQWQLRHGSCQQKGWSFALDDKENGARYKHTPERQRATKWVHFSAQNRRWIEDFCRLMYSHCSLHTEGIDVLTFIDDTFDQRSVAVGYSGEIYREHCVKVSTLPIVLDEEKIEEPPNARIKSLGFGGDRAGDESQHYSVAAIVVPLIDIDMMRPGFISDRPSFASGNDGQLAGVTTTFYENPDLTSMEQAHIDMIMSLHSEFKVQRSRSLDHYFHRDLTDADLQIVNREQVLSRFIHHQQAKRDPYVRQKADFSKTVAPSPTSRILSALKRILKVLAEFGMASTSMDATQVEDGLEHSYIKPHLARQYVLVVPQLWLWKIDNVLITAFPARWDSSNLHSASEYVRSRVEMQNADVSPVKLLHEIVAACLEYQPTFSLFGRQLTYQDAFSGEISRISRDIDQCYKGFRNDLGKSDDRFLEAFKTATTSLLDIDDALNELKMIKRVYQNQAQVWEDMHKDRTLGIECGCSPDEAPRRLYTMMTRLEEDAHSVRESVVTLLQLTQGSASTENALKASEQSKILAIFTVVTVIFVSSHKLYTRHTDSCRPRFRGSPHFSLSKYKASTPRRHGRPVRSPVAQSSVWEVPLYSVRWAGSG
ncbi:hypothetical protein FJTKL_07270 [Diaporthe vaccinii]|uniref:Ankyrin repeat protein n=1 Tax=Diaporthe vaccinii TaxID=105482 RepID=A0ABR4EUA7_9PEZI